MAAMDLATYRQRVAQVVRGFMDVNHTGQKALSTLTEIPRTSLKRRLSGSVSFSTDDLARIGTVFGVTPQEILAAAEAEENAA